MRSCVLVSQESQVHNISSAAFPGHMSFPAYLHKAVNRENLTALEAEELMDLVLSGEVTTAQIAGVLVALKMKGETPEEVLGFARAMRARAVRVWAPVGSEPLIDT